MDDISSRAETRESSVEVEQVHSKPQEKKGWFWSQFMSRTGDCRLLYTLAGAPSC